MAAIVVPFLVVIIILGSIGACIGARSTLSSGSPISMKVLFVMLMVAAIAVATEVASIEAVVVGIAVFGFVYFVAHLFRLLMLFLRVGSENGFSIRRRR